MIFTDGASRGNPGKAGAGVAVFENSVQIDRVYQYLGEKTNNEAEYLAVILALEWMKKEGHKEAKLFCDSQLLVRQLNGEYKVKAPTIVPLFKQAKELINGLTVSFTWVRREDNKEADALANRAINE